MSETPDVPVEEQVAAPETTGETEAVEAAPLELRFAALSDVGRVRRDNQDSGYAGPWLLAVCDGVGGAARGDIASSTAVQQLRRLDEQPAGDPVSLVAGALHRAHDRIGELVEHDPALNGTSTTATLALFDGHRVAIGHVGDTRAYLLRDGVLTRLTKDHTFVQSLIDEGRITEEEARVHPHRNLILQALDGVHEAEPDLFSEEVRAGDRLLLCSDGACGVLDDDRIADILGTATPDFAAVELVRASLEAGSSDNVTCVVADVVPADQGAPVDPTPLLVGAAADLPRRRTGLAAASASRFRGHRSGDTGELEPVPAVDQLPDGAGRAIASDPIDHAEELRYAPRAPRRFVWLKRLSATAVVLGILWMAAAGAWFWSQQQYYVGVHDGAVTIFRGIDSELLGVELGTAYEQSDLAVATLSDYVRGTVENGIEARSLEDARHVIQNLAAEQGGE
ncbi:PP2C family protein-serine/threonine phosphatase [Nocardioides jiangxiensis]|uniref:Protein phosphatase 2C domain-containing protein n=1 Tax=Nocardioides jiangxiensis TaxID=3064524 RepID=A0ABT9B0A7_9ACTN|nr:protein phosphatase 2C domain-containing protein [Nocardioides sp. WY-20]MDO7868279.1 protein phosphatase 2C domain-containing protein [Nocardioides sp. WY-20]